MKIISSGIGIVRWVSELVVVILLCGGLRVTAEEAKSKKGNDKALLGSPDLVPSPERPVGWRGDGSGRFPGANPPVKWGRISGTMKGFHAQATRPKGTGPGEAKPILYGIVEDWLVLGPVAAEGSDKELAQKELIPDEAKLQPDAGDKVGDLEWKPIRVEGSLLYFNRILPDAENLKDKAIYVHTYIYSPRPANVYMRVKATASATVRVNGEQLGKGSGIVYTWRVQLNEGWNRVLARSLSTRTKGGYDIAPWPEGSSCFQLEMYGGEAEEKYEETGILWTVEPPQAGRFSCYQPVIVGDRIYVTSSPAFLVCYDKLTGKRLWTRDNGFCEFITPEERGKFPDLFNQIDPKAKRFKELAESYGGSLDERMELGRLHRELTDLFQKVDPKKYADAEQRGHQESGLASQPVSDGKFIYTWSYMGIVACYDLDGNRKWMTLENEGPQGRHGYELAPMLVGKDFVCETKNIIGFDRETGKISWRTSGKANEFGYTHTPQKSDQTDIVNYDGLGVYKPGLGFFPWSSVTREGKLLFRTDQGGGLKRSTLPDPLTELSGGPRIKEVDSANWFKPDVIYLPGINWGTSMIQASALFHNGLIYSITLGGVLRVEDYNANAPIYSRLLDLNPITWAYPYPYGSGVCASPTLAGNHIYFFGGNGQTLVIKPGRTYELVAKNRIERLLTGKEGGGDFYTPLDHVNDRYPECTVSSPIFDGNRLYYRAERYLYCIQEK